MVDAYRIALLGPEGREGFGFCLYFYGQCLLLMSTPTSMNGPNTLYLLTTVLE